MLNVLRNNEEIIRFESVGASLIRIRSSITCGMPFDFVENRP
jgi:hypothetical protein